MNRIEQNGVNDQRALRRFLGPLVLLILLVASIQLLRAAGVTDWFSREHVDGFQVRVLSFGAWGPLLYVVVCALAVVLLSPAIPLLLVAGVFGAVWGTIYAGLGITLGAAGSFLLARYTMRPTVERWLQRKALLRKLDEGVKQKGWHIVMITRLVPVFPFNLQNYAYGLTGIGFLTYTLVSFACMMPSIAAYVFVGGSLISGGGDVHKTMIYLLVGGALLVLLSFVPLVVRRVSRGPIEE
jgi:uncharacterized membrane protein YdjX (TVP38/TMEM64 family)